MTKIAIIGLGEAGAAFITGWGEEIAKDVVAYDLKLDDPETRHEIEARAGILGITLRESAVAAVSDAELVICTVTADQAMNAAAAGAPGLSRGSFWCDLNSCAPSSKQRSFDVIEAAGGRYVDVAVMAPVHPALNKAPLLISGPHAADVAPILESLPMTLRVVEGEVGRASSIKMVRSVLVKGLEALTAECALAAVSAGVEDEVLASLNKSHPGSDWDAQVAYNFERSLVHGVRRAAEMREVVKTLSDLGLPQDMARSTVEWQQRIADTGVEAPVDPETLGAKKVAETLLPLIREAKD